MLEVLRTGPLATIQDHGRKGYAHLGVPRSGALDPRSLDRANALVGNETTAAALEIAQGRFAAVAHTDVVVAVAGAVEIPPTSIRTGETVEIGPSAHGMFSYLAIRGGIDVAPVLGSRSTDTLSGIGPPIASKGTILKIGNAAAAREVPPASDMPTSELWVRVRWGPRADWFTSKLLTWYQVKMLNRVGARLAGPPLTRAQIKELPSEGLIAGAIQVPPDGQPIIFLSDHPTTGGYPVIAVVHPEDLPMVAQARPGTKVMFYGSER